MMFRTRYIALKTLTLLTGHLCYYKKAQLFQQLHGEYNSFFSLYEKACQAVLWGMQTESKIRRGQVTRIIIPKTGPYLLEGLCLKIPVSFNHKANEKSKIEPLICIIQIINYEEQTLVGYLMVKKRIQRYGLSLSWEVTSWLCRGSVQKAIYHEVVLMGT